MEPSGQMDQSRVLTKSRSEIWDTADEEVHFSRDAISQHITTNQPINQLIVSSQQQQGTSCYQAADLISATTTASSEARHDSLSDVSLHQYHPVLFGHEAQDQAKSSKILHSIGSRLRRGSNYLQAPRLVGQYLLGITIQSWAEFLNTSRMMKAPSTAQQLTRRLVTNLSHFQGNYLCVSLVLVVYCILTSPLLLLAIAGYLFALYVVTARSATGRQLTLIGGFRPNLQQQYSFLTLISLPLLWVAGAPSAVFWVIGASFVVVGLHASLYSSEKLLADSTGTSVAQFNQHQQHQACSPSAQYYNHYPTAATSIHQRQYVSVPLGDTSLPSSPSPTQRPVGSSANTTSYANSLTQWMLFGNSRQADSGGAKSKKELEVTIISQHYAGLGRVYEV